MSSALLGCLSRAVPDAVPRLSDLMSCTTRRPVNNPPPEDGESTRLLRAWSQQAPLLTAAARTLNCSLATHLFTRFGNICRLECSYRAGANTCLNRHAFAERGASRNNGRSIAERINAQRATVVDITMRKNTI